MAEPAIESGWIWIPSLIAFRSSSECGSPAPPPAPDKEAGLAARGLGLSVASTVGASGVVESFVSLGGAPVDALPAPLVVSELRGDEIEPTPGIDRSGVSGGVEAVVSLAGGALFVAAEFVAASCANAELRGDRVKEIVSAIAKNLLLNASRLPFQSSFPGPIYLKFDPDAREYTRPKSCQDAKLSVFSSNFFAKN